MHYVMHSYFVITITFVTSQSGHGHVGEGGSIRATRRKEVQLELRAGRRSNKNYAREGGPIRATRRNDKVNIIVSASSCFSCCFNN